METSSRTPAFPSQPKLYRTREAPAGGFSDAVSMCAGREGRGEGVPAAGAEFIRTEPQPASRGKCSWGQRQSKWARAHWLPGSHQGVVSTASQRAALLPQASSTGRARKPRSLQVSILSSGRSQPGQRACGEPSGQQGALLMSLRAQRGFEQASLARRPSIPHL